MTSIICWTGVDQRGPASLYLASDSRLSNSISTWDFGRKVFACRNSADVFGYCGAVLYPSQVLTQLVEAIDAQLLFPRKANLELRLAIIKNYVSDTAKTFPEKVDFSIVYATRSGEGFGASFHVSQISWHPVNGTLVSIFQMPNESDLILALGSGTTAVNEFQNTWKHSDIGRTSRSVFSAFCDAIESGKDKCSGGAPQLVGIYRQGPANCYGVFYENSCFLYGMHVKDAKNSNIEFRNVLFERCDNLGYPMGQRHARPK